MSAGSTTWPCSPYGNRTHLSSLRGWGPAPIDKRTKSAKGSEGVEPFVASPLVFRQRFCRPPWGPLPGQCQRSQRVSIPYLCLDRAACSAATLWNRSCDPAEAVGLEPTTGFPAPAFEAGPSSGRMTSVVQFQGLGSNERLRVQGPTLLPLNYPGIHRQFGERESNPHRQNQKLPAYR